MDLTNLFSTAGKIAGIGGLSIALIIIIFRTVIADKVLGTLSPAAKERTLRLMIISTVIVGLAGLCSYAFSPVLASWANQNFLSVGGSAKVGGGAKIEQKTDIGKDLDVKGDLQVGPGGKKD